MKKKLAALVLAVACLLGMQTVGAEQAQGVAPMEQGRTYQGAPINGGMVNDPIPPAPQNWEKDAGNGTIQCCCYKPCYTYRYECEMCPKEVKRTCCRAVPQYYEVQRCRYVPQYYTETCCRMCPQYYCVTDCVQCPKYTCHRCCTWQPEYSTKCCPQPCAPACPAPCAPADCCQ